MWSGFSSAATAALAGTCQVAIQVQVFNSAGLFLQDITYAVTGGTVAEDETAEIRRVLTLTLNDPNLMPDPSNESALLNPLSGNEIKVWRGVWVPGAALPELAPLGVFRLSKPSVSDSGTAWSMTITGNDRSSEISRRAWTGPYTAAAGQTIPAAIKAIINSRWTGPTLTFNLFPSAVKVATGYVLGLQFTSSGAQAASGSTSGNNDPWADCQALATSAGCELFFDRTGAVIMRPVPQPTTLPSQWTFAEGPGCLITSATRALDETGFFNKVQVVGTGATVTNSDGSVSPAAPVIGTASSSDPLLGTSGPLGTRPDIITDPHISTTSDANNSAASKLSKVMSQLDSTTFQAVENPALDAGDQDTLTRARMLLDDNYIVQSVTHPLDAVTLMAVTNRPFSVSVS